MANKKKRNRNKKGPGGGGPKKPPQQRQGAKSGGGQAAGDGEAEKAAPTSGPQRPPSNKPQKQAKQARAQGEPRMSAAQRRAAARQAARRKRQVTTVVVPLVIILVVVGALFLLNGGVEGGGKVSAASDVKVDGSPRTENLAIGDEVPSFSAPELTEGTVNWEDYAGKPVALSVWASWCPNCQKEMPVLESLSQEFPEIPVVSIVTSQGQEPGPTPEQYVAENDITFPVAVDDAAGKMREAMGVTGFPTLYMVNPDGTVAEVVAGFSSEEDLRSRFQSLASGTSAPAPETDKKNKDAEEVGP